MPIYAYRCDSCGHAKDVLQKISDPLLTVCPACSAESFKKQVTAAGFQLKGSGWYVTDFRGGATAPSAEAGGAKESAGSSSEPPAAQDKSGKTETAVSSTAASTTATPSAPASGGTSSTPTASSST